MGDDRLIIGELSLPKLLGWPLFLGAICALSVVGDPGDDAFALTFGFLALAMFLFAVICYCQLDRGLYIQDGVLHESVFRKSVRVDGIRQVRRTIGYPTWFRTVLEIECGVRDAGITGGYETGGTQVISVLTTLYKTPAAIMLARLEEQGVKVVGSRTNLLDLPGRR